MRDVKIVRWNLWSCPNSFHPQFLRFTSPLMRESLSQHNESTRSTNWRQEIMNFIRSMLKPSFFINSFISFGKRNWKKSKKYDFQLFKLFFFVHRRHRRWNMQDTSTVPYVLDIKGCRNGTQKKPFSVSANSENSFSSALRFTPLMKKKVGC